MEIRQSAGKSYAYLLGVYLGDGCVTSQGGKQVFKLNTIDEDFALATKTAIEDCGYGTAKIYKYDVKKSRKPNYSLWCGSQPLCERLVSDCNGKLIFPYFQSVEYRKEFIVGVMDSEGFVAANKNKTNRKYYMGYKSCDVWVPELISLMQSIGLKIGKRQTEEPRQPHYKAPTRFHINMQSWVDSGMRFNIKRKQSRVDEWSASGAYENRSRFPRKLTSTTNTLNAERR